MPPNSTLRKEAPQGLSPQAVLKSRQEHGSNSLYIRPHRGVFRMVREVITEPMFLLLALACGLYFLIGDTVEAWLMFVSVLFVIAIEIIQEFRSERALTALLQYAQPRVRVIRAGIRMEIPVEEVVVGDLILFAEGERIAADGALVQQNDLSIDEAVLTGESLPADKSLEPEHNRVFQGTTVSAGLGIARVTAVGAGTEFGKLGKSIESIDAEPTPLQRQINRFVRQMVLAGLLAFVVVLAINYHYEGAFLPALLFSMAFALALVPEEIPVAFTAFMAIGAYRMTKQNVLVKQPKTVESLGSATVICLDKTGTITENKMSMAEVVDFSGNDRVLEYAMWASEPEPFDAMEKAIHLAWETSAEGGNGKRGYQMVHEYPLGGIPPMMTHVYENGQDGRIIAAKGAVERILRVCGQTDGIREKVMARTMEMANKGYRILGVSSASWEGSDFPEHQDGFDWQFEGLIALYDPPKKNIRKVMEQFYEAGISVRMITGDYPQTALNIATESGIRHDGAILNGEEVMEMAPEALQRAVRHTAIFARMFPEAKLRVVEALKANGEVVGMTGDGVNDGPALKAAQIGVAMGRRGTEIAKGAASMVLLDDNLENMVFAIHTGRKIYHNLHKAIRYIISIHLPIVLTVLLPLVFGWPFLHILTPIHVIFLELIMDPTCAVAFENEPAEPGLLRKPPRDARAGLFSSRQLSISLLQGLAITAGILAMYQYGVQHGYNEDATRSLVFVTLMCSNIFLTFVNRSFEYTIIRTIRYPNRVLWYILLAAAGLLALILLVPAMGRLFHIAPISLTDLGLCLLAALVSTGWMEVWKGLRR